MRAVSNWRAATACRARTVVVASAAPVVACPAIPDIARTSKVDGVWYWASPIEARLCAGEEVVLVGGGNSAGQGVRLSFPLSSY